MGEGGGILLSASVFYDEEEKVRRIDSIDQYLVFFLQILIKLVFLLGRLEYQFYMYPDMLELHCKS